mmetsp:Transcript_24576/g.41199  ORF Transcript_24576/g.41199 Transcript_24576/m.41199 type:complete len:203 (+) Transcript_24576:207-815(+)
MTKIKKKEGPDRLITYCTTREAEGEGAFRDCERISSIRLAPRRGPWWEGFQQSLSRKVRRCRSGSVCPAARDHCHRRCRNQQRTREFHQETLRPPRVQNIRALGDLHRNVPPLSGPERSDPLLQREWQLHQSRAQSPQGHRQRGQGQRRPCRRRGQLPSQGHHQPHLLQRTWALLLLLLLPQQPQRFHHQSSHDTQSRDRGR